MTNTEAITRELVAVHGFYDRELSAGALRIWLDVIGDYPPAAIVGALKAHMSDPDAGHYCPKPADVIRQLRGNADEAAALAWADVLAAVRDGTTLNMLDAPALLALQSLGGVSVVGRTDESQNGFLQARFVTAYRAFRHREERNGLALAADTVPAIVNATTSRMRRLKA